MEWVFQPVIEPVVSVESHEDGMFFTRFQFAKFVVHLSRITSVITEPERMIIHFKNTRKSGFACITLLSTVGGWGWVKSRKSFQ